MLWKAYIRRGEENGLKFPRGVKGREGFLSTGTGVQSDWSFSLWGILDGQHWKKKKNKVVEGEREEKCHKSESAGERLLPCQK